MKDIAYSNIKRGSILNSILTKAVFSTRSSCWLWWSTNKTRPAMENKPSSAQIQCENFLRTGRRYSAARRRIFRRFLPQFTTKSRIPHQHRHPYRKFNQKNSTVKNQVLKLTHIPDSINNPKQNEAHACLSHLIKTFQLLGHTQIHIQSRIGESEKHSGNHVCLLEKWVMKMNRAGSDGESISVYVWVFGKNRGIEFSI